MKLETKELRCRMKSRIKTCSFKMKEKNKQK